MGLYTTKTTNRILAIYHTQVDECIEKMSTRQYNSEEEDGDLDIEDWNKFKEHQYIGLLFLSGKDGIPTFIPNKNLKFFYSLSFVEIQNILKMMIELARHNGFTTIDGDNNAI